MEREPSAVASTAPITTFRREPAAETRQVVVDVVIPVLNEAHVLERSVGIVQRFLDDHFPYSWRIVIVDNGSTDGTQQIAARLSAEDPAIVFEHLAERGRGRALRYAWSRSTADVSCYTDVDLSTELAALPKLVSAIVIDGYDLATGSRLLPASTTVRTFRREVISRAYNLLLKLVLQPSFSDAQCGFKAVSRRVVEEVVPDVEDESWFFDTELMVLAERRRFRVKDIPVCWVEDGDSRVKIVRTAWDDIKGVCRLRWRFLRGVLPVVPGVAPAPERPGPRGVLGEG
ncbi:MAG: glycosyltransferase [Gemmatimonadaceae bacterium]